jgi:uncharacterized protein (DUF1501 family)
MKRRSFVLGSGAATGVSLGAGVPGSWMRLLAHELADSSQTGDRILVVIQLSGGNDGLNTVVPYRHDAYLKARPKLRIAEKDAVRIDDETALHPSMKSFEKLMADNRFSVVEGVGYERPNRSHFESMDIWHTCQSKQNRTKSGWLGRFFASSSEPDRLDSPGLHLGGEPLPLALVERGVQIPSLASVDQFRLKNKPETGDIGMESSVVSEMNNVTRESSGPDELLSFVSTSTSAALEASRRLESALSNPDSSGDFPATHLGEKLKIISRLILAGMGTRVYYVTLDGFDTHANQLVAHAGLLRQWSEAVSAFYARLGAAGQQDRVLTMTFSEFGRRVAENASLGTDHGAAAPMFFCGPAMPKLSVGKRPSLTDLDDGDLRFQIDFRSAYATVIEDWMGVPSQPVLQSQYSKIDLFA